MPYDYHAALAKGIRQAAARYADDLRAMEDSVLRASPGGAARSPYDFTYEVVFVNRRIAARMRNEDPGPSPFEGWIVAPPEFCEKERAIAEVLDSAEELAEAWLAVSPDAIETVTPLPQGEFTPIFGATLCERHMHYHDAQLNLIQAMGGDGDVHWS